MVRAWIAHARDSIRFFFFIYFFLPTVFILNIIAETRARSVIKFEIEKKKTKKSLLKWLFIRTHFVTSTICR